MTSTYYSVLTKKEYTDDQGEIHRTWYKAGFMKETEAGGRFLTLYGHPDTTYHLLPQEKEAVIHLDD